MKIFYSVFTLIMLIALIGNAQPTLTGTNPAKNTLNAPVNTNITLTFSEAMNVATASSSSIKVNSLRSGTRTITGGGVFTGGGTNTITFNPARDFFANDKVSVTSTTNCASTSNNPMTWPNVAVFNTASAISSASYPGYINIRGSGTINNVSSMAVGDFNGDNYLDIVYIDDLTDKVILIKNLGNDMFAAGVALPGGVAGMTEIKTIDLEGDGDLDLVGTYGVVGIYVYTNDGTGSFTYSTKTLTAVSTAFKDIEVADMNGDGFMDLVFGNSATSSSIFCFLNNGTGTFTQSSNITGGGGFNRFTTADFNNDGFIDVAVANSTTSNITVRFNDGSALLYGGATYAMTGGNGYYIKSADLDNDGDVDLAVLLQPNKVQVMTNNGSGVFTAQPAISLSQYPTYGFSAMNVADVDGDNKVDIIVAGAGSSNNGVYTVLANRGGMSFEEFNYFNYTGVSYTATELEIGDFNNDGKQDLVTLGSCNLIYAPADEMPVITGFTPNYGTIPTTITITGDHLLTVGAVKIGGNNTRADSYTIVNDHTIIAVVDTGTTSGPVYVCTPHGCVASTENFNVQFKVSYTTPAHYTSSVNQTSNVTINFDHAASPHVNTGSDIVIYGSMSGLHSTPSTGLTTGGGSNVVSINPNKDFARGERVTTIVKGTTTDSIGIPISKPYIFSFDVKPATVTTATFSPLTAIAYGSNPNSNAFADIDNDGDMDEFMAIATGNQLQYKRNLGNGTFGPVTTLNLFGPPSTIELADFDNDGDMDVYCGGYIFTNNGSGTFTSSPLTGGSQMDSGDLNGDGLVDFIVISGNSIYRVNNNGGMNFTYSYYILTLPTYLTDLFNPTLVDFDIDGDLDIVAGRSNSDTLYCYKNDGAGNFSFHSKVTTPAGGSGFVHQFAVGDFNNDGLPDLAVPTRLNDLVEIFRGNGNGFSWNSTLVVNNPPSATANWFVLWVTCGDFDGDGKTDIMTADQVGNSVTYLRNTTIGSISFAAPVHISLGSSVGPYCVCPVDIDNDGDLDFASCNQLNNTSTIGFNNGTTTIPNLTSFTPSSGNVGTVVTLTGTNLSCVTAVTVNGVNAPVFTVVSATQINVTVPAGASTGQIAVTCGTTTVAAPGVFYICPSGQVTPTFSISASETFPVCADIPVTYSYSVTNPGVNPNYTWYKNGSPVAYTNTYTSLVSNGTSVYCVFSSSDACLSTSTLTSNTITSSISTLPGPISSITGSTTVCSSNNSSFTASASANATSYTWTLPSGWAGNSSTNSITVTPDSLNGYLTVIGVNACGSGQPQSVFCDVSGGSVTVSASASNPTICQGSSTTLTANSSGSVTASPFSWLKGFGGPNYDNSFSDITTDASGNVYAIGNFNGGMTIDSLSLSSHSLTSQGAFGIMKISPQGIALWAKEIYSTVEVYGKAIIYDKTNNVFYVSGYFDGTFTLGTFTLTGPGLFTAKFDASGNCLWLVKATTTNTNGIIADDIQIDPSGNPYISLKLRGTCVFGTLSATGPSTGDVAVVKYNASNGTALWIAKSTGATGTLTDIDLAVDNSGNAYVYGTFTNAITFGTNSYTSSGGSDIYLAKFSSAGAFVWSKKYNASFSVEGINLGLTYDGNNSIYFGGSYATSIVFGTQTLTTSSAYSQFFVKMNLAGTVIWATNGFQGASSISSQLYADLAFQSGKLYSMQTFSSSTNATWGSFTSPITRLYETMLVAIDSAGGTPLKVVCSDGPDNDYGHQISVSNTEDIYVIGQAWCSAKFGNQHIITNGSTDGFIVKVLPMNSGSGGTVTYTWTPGNLTGSSVNVTPSSTTTYTVTANGGCGSPTANVTVTVNPAPTVAVSPGSPAICSGGSVSLTASGATSYVWSPSTGLSGTTGATVSASPASTTTYTVTGTSSGCTGTQNITVTVNSVPNISFSPTSPAVCPGGNITITASGGSTYSWSPATNLNSTTGSTVICTPSSNITYTVTATGAGGCTNTGNITVSVNSIPNITASTTTPSICAGNSCTLNASGGQTYTWMPGNLSGSSVPVSPTTSTTYTVTGTNASGCTNTATVNITVNALPTITTSVDIPSFCEGNSTDITASGGDIYSWSPATGLNSTTGATVTATPGGTIQYTVTGTDLNGCSNTAIADVTVFPLPTLTINSTAYEVCLGNSVTLTAGGADTYVWTGGIDNGLPFTPASSENYTVTGTNTTTGCSADTTITITVDAIPVVTANATETDVCFGSSVTLTGGGASTYTWDNGVIDGVAFVPADTATYTVTGTTPGGCTNTASVTVNILPLPVVDYIQAPDTLCNNDGAIILSGGTPSGGDYSGTGVSSGSFDPTVAGIGNHIITYTYTDVNTCSASIAQTIVVDDCTGMTYSGSISGCNIYPNPFRSNIFVVTDEFVGSRVEVVNVLGETIYSVNISGNITEINLSGLVKGVYLIKIHNDQSGFVKTLVKE